MVIIGHRGFKAEYPENTLLGFRKVFSEQIPYVELDVHLSRDKKLVVTHDFFVTDHLYRETSGGPLRRAGELVSQLSVAELKSYIIGQNHNLKTGYPRKKNGEERIPTLNEVLDLQAEFPHLLIHWQIEIKYLEHHQSPTREELVRSTIELLQKYNFIKQTTIYSFDVEILRWFRKLAPELKINFLYEGEDVLGRWGRFLSIELKLPNWKKCQKIINELKPNVFSPNYLFLKYFAGWKKYFPKSQRNFSIYVWTCNDQQDLEKFILEKEIDGIITDEPLLLRKLIESKS